MFSHLSMLADDNSDGVDFSVSSGSYCMEVGPVLMRALSMLADDNFDGVDFALSSGSHCMEVGTVWRG